MKKVLVLLILANVVLYLWRGYVQDANVQVVTAPSSAEIAQLILLTEQQPVELNDQVGIEDTIDPENSQEPTKAVVTKPAQPSCFAVGPLSRQADAEQLAKNMAQSNIRSEIRKTRILPKEGMRYLVFIPSMERDSARKLAGELTTKGVKDFYVSGKSFIALGVFSSKAGALKRAEEIKDMGYVTAIKEEGAARTEYWLDAVLDGDSTTTPSELDAILSRYAKARLLTRECSEIALSAAKP